MTEHPPLSEEGWAIPGLARKAHYFVASIALCGRWMLPLGNGRREYDTSWNMTTNKAYDCAPCARAVALRREAAGAT